MNQILNKEVETDLLLREVRIKPIKTLLSKNTMVLDIQSILFENILFDDLEKKDTIYSSELNYMSTNELDTKNNTHCVYDLIRYAMKVVLKPNMYFNYGVTNKCYFHKESMNYNLKDIQNFLKVFCYYYDINTDTKEINEISQKLKNRMDNDVYVRDFINLMQLSFHYYDINSSNTDYTTINDMFKTMIYRSIILLALHYKKQNRLTDFVIMRMNYL